MKQLDKQLAAEVGARITQRREELGLSKLRLAKNMTVARSGRPIDHCRLIQWERGRSMPDAEHLKFLATELRCTTDWLLGLDRGVPAAPPSEELSDGDAFW